MSLPYMNVPACVYLSVSLHVHSPPYVCPFRVYDPSCACPLRVFFPRVYVPDGICMYVPHRIVGGVDRFM